MNRKSKGSQADARNYAIRLLRYRPRSKREMKDRLRRKGFDGNQVMDAMRYLEKAGLIRDDVLAAGLFRNAVERRHLGRRGVEMFLAKRGIDRDLINETMAAHSREMEENSALALASRKIRSLQNYSEAVVRRRLGGMLQRRGFSADVINATLRSITKHQIQ